MFSDLCKVVVFLIAHLFLSCSFNCGWARARSFSADWLWCCPPGGRSKSPSPAFLRTTAWPRSLPPFIPPWPVALVTCSAAMNSIDTLRCSSSRRIRAERVRCDRNAESSTRCTHQSAAFSSTSEPCSASTSKLTRTHAHTHNYFDCFLNTCMLVYQDKEMITAVL